MTARYFDDGPTPETAAPSTDPRPWTSTRVVGQCLPRVDAYDRLSGTAVYPTDVVLPGMLYGAILRSPHSRARVRAVDVTVAEGMPGVRAVISGSSPAAAVRWFYSRSVSTALFDPDIRHEGEEVAAVAADTPYQAADALRAIRVDYEVLPPLSDETAALAAAAPLVAPEGNRVGEPRTYVRGDVEAGFAAADVVLEQRYSTACEVHNAMEPHGAVARWDGDTLTVWESSQGVFAIQRTLAQVLGVPLARVRVVGHYMGGGFGAKLQAGKYTVIAALLARLTAHPVKLVLSREECFLCVGNRPPAHMRLKAGATRDGRLTALDFEGLGASGAYPAGGASLLDWVVRDLYTCPNVRCTTTDVLLNAGPARPFRAPGHPQGAWALEQTLDALAEALDLDPVELRLRNVPSVSQANDNRPYTSTGLRQCLEEGAEAFGWTEARRRDRGAGHLRRGVGMAAGTWVAGAGGPPATIIVRLFADGSVNLNMGASDIGTGTKTVMAMVVAEELGVALDRIAVEHADTGTTQFATPSGGSKTVPTESPAVRDAALAVKRQLLDLAAAEMGVPASELTLDGAAVVSRTDPERRRDIATLEGFQRRGVVVGVGTRGPNPEGKVTVPFAAQFCEVEVNTATGEVKVLRFLGAHDSGRVMNRMTYDNQVCGGIVQGVAFALTEERILDRGQTGKVVNRNLHDYKLPTALDSPGRVDSLPVDPGDVEANTTGAKGLGEPVTIPTSAAVANAIYHATGVRVTSTPVTPGRLVELLARRAKEA